MIFRNKLLFRPEGDSNGGSSAGTGFMGSNIPNSTVPTTDGGNAPADIVYPEGFDETLKGNKSLLKFYDAEKKNFNIPNIMKSYVNMESFLGKDKIPVPNETYTEDQWNQVYDKLGRPSREKFEVKNNLPKGMAEDKEFFNKYLDTAHKAGLLPKQAQALVDFFNQESTQITSKLEAAEAAAHSEKIGNLQKEWGNDYSAKLERASLALEQFASPELIKEMKDEGLLDSPAMTRIFYKIAESMNEDSFKSEVRNSVGATRDDLMRQIEQMHQPNHPYMNRNHPQHQYYLDQRLKLQRMLDK